MERADDRDRIPAEDVKRAHTMEPAEGPREPGKDADELRPPHPVEPAEGPREPQGDEPADSAR